MLGRTGELEKTDKLVRKWLVDDLENIDCFESWLGDMAAEGLFLDHLGDGFTDKSKAYFKRGTPRKTRYRIDVRTQKLSEDELALYDSCGWHVVDSRERPAMSTHQLEFYIFQTDENAAVPELHTDPEEQAASLRLLNRSCRNELLLMVILTAIFIAAIVWPVFDTPRERFQWLVNGNLNGCLLVVYLLYIIQMARQLHNVRRLRRRLTLGEPLDHHADYRAAHRSFLVVRGGHLALAWGCLTYCVVMLVMLSVDSYLPHPPPADDWAPDFPTLRLEEVCGPGNYENTYYDHGRTMTAVVEDTLQEEGTVGGEAVELYNTTYRMPFVWVTPYLLESYLGAQNSDYYTKEQLDTDLVDEAWLLHFEGDQSNQTLLVREGRYMVEVTFSGTTQIADALPLLAEKLAAA